MRRFGRPTGLAAEDRVELVIVPYGEVLAVRLNEQPLGEVPATGPAWHVDVSTRLVARNELVVAGGPLDTPPVVRLEITAAASG